MSLKGRLVRLAWARPDLRDDLLGLLKTDRQARDLGQSFVRSPDNRTDAIKPANGQSFTARELQRLIGGPIEVINMDGPWVMVVSQKGGEPNEGASRLVRTSVGGPAVVLLGTMLPD